MTTGRRLCASVLCLPVLVCSWPWGEGAAAVAHAAESVQRPALPTVGAPAPPFQLWDLDGKAVSLAAYRGKVVLINFWATWCGPCRVEMPGMELLYRQLKGKGFEILAVSTDRQGAAVTRPFREALGLTFPILHDSDFRVGQSYGVVSLPMSFIVDRKGVVTHRIPGARNWQAPGTAESIQKLLQTR